MQGCPVLMILNLEFHLKPRPKQTKLPNTISHIKYHELEMVQLRKALVALAEHIGLVISIYT